MTEALQQENARTVNQGIQGCSVECEWPPCCDWMASRLVAAQVFRIESQNLLYSRHLKSTALDMRHDRSNHEGSTCAQLVLDHTQLRSCKTTNGDPVAAFI